MRKKLIAFLLVCVTALSIAVPVNATEAVPYKTTVDAVQIVRDVEVITPFHEVTQIFWRNSNGRRQFRVWSVTNGRWLTDWLYV